MIYEAIMIFKDIRLALSELLQDTGTLTGQSTDNRAVLLLVRTQVVLSLILAEVERVDKKT